MCTFIFGTCDQGALDSVAAIVKSHGRRATLIDEPTLAVQLPKGQCLFLTTNWHCDCHAELGNYEMRSILHDDRNRHDVRAAAERRKMGWSEARIQKWLEQRATADKRPKGQVVPCSTVVEFLALVQEVLLSGGTSQFGLLHHLHDGDVPDIDMVIVPRRIKLEELTEEVLGSLPDGQLLLVRP